MRRARAFARYGRRLIALSLWEHWLLAWAYSAIVATEVGLRVAGYQELVRHLERRPTHLSAAQTVSGETLARAARAGRLIAVVARFHVVRARCLHQSLVLHWWLRRQGLPSEIRIGVRKEAGELKAHAWVELDGHVVNDPPWVAVAFTPLSAVGDQDLRGIRGGLGAASAV